MAEVCVDGALVKVSPPPTLTLVPPLIPLRIPGGQQVVVTVDGKSALITKDLEKWVSTYTSGYQTPTHLTPGKVDGASLDGDPSKMTELTTIDSTKAVVMMDTTFKMKLKVDPTAQAKNPKGEPDTNSSYTVDVSFTASGQKSPVYSSA